MQFCTVLVALFGDSLQLGMALRFGVRAILIVLVVCIPLLAYVPQRRLTPAGLVLERWGDTSFPIPWQLNVTRGANVAGARDVAEVFRQAFQSWTGVSTARVSFAEGATTTAVNAAQDGINLISLAPAGYNSDAPSLTILYTVTNPGTGQFPGQILEADIVFNPQALLSTDMSVPPDRYDLQTLAVHEIGHLLGLDHSGLVSAAMFSNTVRGSSLLRILSTDDAVGISNLYPTDGFFTTRGGLQGMVRTASGSPMFGAQVVVIDGIGTPVVSTLTEPDGSYIVHGLDPGSYSVYAEPMDGPLTSAGIPTLGPAYPNQTPGTGFTTRFAVTAAPPSTVTLTKTGGDNQTGAPARALPQRLEVTLRDSAGNPVAGGLVWFAATSGGGAVVPIQAATDAQGKASTTAYLGKGALQTFTASALNRSVNFTAVPSLATPTLISIGPASRVRGQNVNVTLTGAGFVGGTTTGAATVIVSGTGVTASTVNVTNSTILTTTLTIAADAEMGARGLTVMTAGGTSNPVTFTVLAVPALLSISPAFGLPGATVSVTLTGSGFLAGATTVLASGTDVTVSAASVINAAALTATFTIASGATSGFRNVRAMTVGGTSNTLNFTVCCAIAPISGLPGTIVPVTLTGPSFVAGVTTVAIGGTGITIGALNVTNATTLTTTLTIAAGAPPGDRSVTVTTGSASGSVTFWVAATQVTDNSSRVPPNYYAFLPPATGISYVDPIFGSTIKRMSDATVSPDIAYGTGFLPFISNEYSTMSPFNSDNSRILALHFSYFGLYNGIFDGAGNFIKNLPFAVSASTEPRWSRTKPDILYFISGNQLKQLDISTDAISVLHTFAEYTSISGKGESDISFDGDHFVLIGNNRFVFVYEISSDSKGSTLDTEGRIFDSLYITPNNNVTISWYDRGTARYTGIELFDRNMNFLRQAARAGGHMDVTRDDQGVEVLVWANSADAGATCPNSIVKIRLDNGQQTCILSLDQSLALHISGADNSGWFFVDTYAPSDPAPSPGSWVPYTNEILQVKLDGTQVRRLAHHRSRPNAFDTYNYEPRVSASRDGSRIVFTSNYGLQSILGYSSLYSDIYLIILP